MEQVLVVKQSHVEALKIKEGVNDIKIAKKMSYLDYLLHTKKCDFIPREQAEIDVNYRQIIPYVIFEYHGKLLSYKRFKGVGEGRLAGKNSIGVGGHVNLLDYRYNNETNILTLMNATKREVCEELAIFDFDNLEFSPFATINDLSNNVGKVHLGILFFCHLTDDSFPVNILDENLGELEFLSLVDLKKRKEKYENWSQMTIDSLTNNPV